TGKEGVVEGRDYRGVEVISALKHIPDSPWYMVAKIDTSEALSAWRFWAGIIIASIAGLLAAALALVGLIWQRRQRLAYQALYQAELETQALRSHFEYLVKYANDIILLVDENQNIVEANDRALEAYGYTRQEMLGMPLAALIPTRDLPAYEARLQKIQQKGTIVVEAIHQRKDGSTFPVEASGRTIKIEDKPYLQEIIRDITERKQTEEILRASEARYRNLVEQAWDAIFVVDASGKILLVNQQACQMLGYTEEELLQLNIADTYPVEQRGMAAKRIAMAQVGQPLRYDRLMLRKDGTTIPVEVNIGMLPNGLIQGIVRDITERKQAEEELKHLSLTLRAIRDVNQLISHEKDRNRLLEGVCRCLTENRSYQGVWIALLDESSKLVTHAQVGFGRSFLPVVEQLKQGILPPCGQQAMIQSEVVAISEQRSTCDGCLLSGEADGKAALTVRLEHDNTVYGLLSAVMPPDFMTAAEIGLFQELANDCAFALYDIDLQDKHKATEESLRRSERNFRDSIENSPLGICIVTADGETVYANRALPDIYGYSSVEELKAVPTRERYTPESYAEHQERKEKRRRGEFVPSSYEISIVSKSGEVRNLAVSRGEVQWNGKRQFQVAYQDLTERKRADEALQQSEEKYRTILAEIADSYFEVDLAGNLTFVNNATCRNLRYSREELLGMNYRDFTAKEDIEHVYQAFNEVYRTGEPNKGFLWKIIRKDGSIGFADTSASLLRSQGGEIIGFRGVGRDITERKLAEEERRQLELKAQNTSRLASVGEMAAGVAHEINNPLTAVTGYAQLLMEREDIPSDIRSDLEAINDGARRVAGIVRTLLAFSRQT
ncbi:MAG: hypothetical protein A2Z75_00560, partial [Chloroflexi bacterium RBG_13_50_10]